MIDAAFWTELSLRVRPEASESISELLQDVTGNGVTIEPPIQALGPDEGYVLDYEAPLVLRAYVYGPVLPVQRRSISRRLRRAGAESAIVGRLTWRTVRAEDWSETWKEHYNVEHVGRVVIRPSWRDYTAAPGDIVVSLDPGMAFGTGHHPTTRMCLLAMQELLKPGDHVLDLGCGSGILALAAIGLGARDVIAADTEEQAVAATHANVALNDADGRIEVYHGSIETAKPAAPYDFVLANINAATVTALAGEIAQALKPGAFVIAGGIIDEREAGCIEALERGGLRIQQRLTEGDWRSFVARR